MGTKPASMRKLNKLLGKILPQYILLGLISIFPSPSLVSILTLTSTSFASLISKHSFAAENRDLAQQELAAVDTAIEEIQDWLIDANKKQSSEEKDLQQAAEEIAKVSDSVDSTQKTLAETESQLTALRARNSQLQSEKAEQDKVLAQAIRAAYMAGEQSTIKLLLNQESVSESARLLHYYRLFSESQIEKVEAFRNTLAEIAEVGSKLESETEQLTSTKNTLSQQMLSLDQARENQQQALISLKSSISSRSSELEQLEINQAELQQLIEQINQAIERIPSSADARPFEEQRGNLMLPVDGSIISSFGSSYGNGNLTRQGISIAVTEGTAVQTVHPGRVVFSDWLRGSGLLVIVDHGDGYMSLYGANQALSKNAGDWVNAGDILATSGKLTEQEVAGIYFEIRLHGEAQNPAIWINSTN